MNTAKTEIISNAIYVDFNASKVTADTKGYKEIKLSEKSTKGTLASVAKLNANMVQPKIEEPKAEVTAKVEEAKVVPVTAEAPVQANQVETPSVAPVIEKHPNHKVVTWTYGIVYGTKNCAKQLNTKPAVTEKITKLGDIQMPEKTPIKDETTTVVNDKKVEVEDATTKKINQLKEVAAQNIEVNNQVVAANGERDAAKEENEAAIKAARQAEIEKEEAIAKEKTAKERKEEAIKANKFAQESVDATTQRLNEFRQKQIGKVQEFKAETGKLNGDTKVQQETAKQAQAVTLTSLDTAKRVNEEAAEIEDKTRTLTVGLKEINSLLSENNVPINIDEELEHEKNNEESYTFIKN